MENGKNFINKQNSNNRIDSNDKQKKSLQINMYAAKLVIISK